jgi:P-type Cu2+ transporter
MLADPHLAPGAANTATLDDPAEQGGFTSWSAAAGGARVARSHFRLSGLYCAACAGLIEQALRAEAGVLDAEVSYAAEWRPCGRPDTTRCPI